MNRARAIATAAFALFIPFHALGHSESNTTHTPFNCGHKGGYDCMKQLPENSLALLAHLEDLQKKPNFKYLEFDIRETYDKELVVFHDKTIRKLLPYKGYNKKQYKELSAPVYKGRSNNLADKPIYTWKVSDLTLAQLQTLSLEGREPDPDNHMLFKVPTLEQYINELRGRLTKPIVFEIKGLKSHHGRKKLVDIVVKYTNSIGGNRPSGTLYKAFPYQQVSIINITGLKDQFEEVHPVCMKLKAHGIDIYRAFSHDSLCDFFYKRKPKLSIARKITNAVKRPLQRMGVKHHIKQHESELNPANFHDPRLIHSEPKSAFRNIRFVQSPISEANKVIEKLSSIDDDKLLIFVHGRGKHPRKGQKIMSTLASDYDTAVLMFNWDSWICQSYCKTLSGPYSSKHPYGNAIAAASDLAALMKALRTLKKDKPKMRISMLVHSMGNIIFKEMMECYAGEITNGEVFIDNLILNSADVDRENHRKWLETVSFADDIFVTATRDDFTLGAVELMLYRPMLGQGFEPNSPSKSFAKNAHYLDFTNVGSSHRKYHDRKYRKFFKSAFASDSWANCPAGYPIDMKNFDYTCLTQPASGEH